MIKNTSRIYFTILLLSLTFSFHCASSSKNILHSDNDTLISIIHEHFANKKVVSEFIMFSGYKDNTINKTKSTNHFPKGLDTKDSLTLHYDFFDLLLKEKKITKTEHELLNHLKYSVFQFPKSLQSSKIKTVSKETYSISPKGYKVREFNQYSPVLLFNNKAIIYRNYHNQYGSLPAVSDGTFYLFVKSNSKWDVAYKWTAWIS